MIVPTASDPTPLAPSSLRPQTQDGYVAKGANGVDCAAIVVAQPLFTVIGGFVQTLDGWRCVGLLVMQSNGLAVGRDDRLDELFAIQGQLARQIPVACGLKKP